jgi:hypothetical protein
MDERLRERLTSAMASSAANSDESSASAHSPAAHQCAANSAARWPDLHDRSNIGGERRRDVAVQTSARWQQRGVHRLAEQSMTVAEASWLGSTTRICLSTVRPVRRPTNRRRARRRRTAVGARPWLLPRNHPQQLLCFRGQTLDSGHDHPLERGQITKDCDGPCRELFGEECVALRAPRPALHQRLVSWGPECRRSSGPSPRDRDRRGGAA